MTTPQQRWRMRPTTPPTSSALAIVLAAALLALVPVALYLPGWLAECACLGWVFIAVVWAHEIIWKQLDRRGRRER